MSVHTIRFAGMLKDAGFRVALVDTEEPKVGTGVTDEFYRYPEIQRFELRGTWRLRSRGLYRTVTEAFERRALVRELDRIYKAFQPDIVHVHWIDKRAYDCVIARMHPIVLTCWGSDINTLVDEPDNHSIERHYVKVALQRADHVTADSPEVLRRAEKISARALNSSLFYFGIDFQAFGHSRSEDQSKLRTQLGIDASATVLFSPRAMRPLMGHHHVVEAFARLLKSSGRDDIVLVLKRYLPFADDYEARICRLIQELGLSSRVHWLGETPNSQMPVEYAMADVIVNYPERDALPVTFFEAAASRRSVVTCSLPSYNAFLQPGMFWEVDPADPDALAKSLQQCLSATAEERLVRADRAYQVAWNHGDYHNCILKLQKIYAAVSTARQH